MIRNAHTKTFAALFAAIMVVSMMAPVAGAAVASGADDVTTDFDDDVEALSLDADGTVDSADGELPRQDADDVDIDSNLREEFDRPGSVDVVVRMDQADLSGVSEDAAVDELKHHAASTQMNVLRFAEMSDGIEAKNQFWIANMVLLEVDSGDALKEIAAIDGVDRLHANFELEQTGGPDVGAGDAVDVDSSSVQTDDYETTYGLDMINATEVWDNFGTQGEGAAVAVLDTGIDADHPDLDLYTEDPDDPTYPGGYMSFDEDGNQLPDAEPEDTSGHGTHVSGTVAGAENPEGVDESFGVAPEIDLLHGQAIPGGGGSFTQVAASMEWAVDDTHADIATMSLGGGGYHSEMVEPSENARNAGVVLVTSAGNSGDGSSGAPGNVYPNFASGAVNADADVAGFSSGEEITTDSAYPDAPDYWPDEYVVPNAAAPGVDVLSSVPGGGYDDTYSGTSMSAPHKAGAFALMVAASGGDADREMLYDALEETAWKPDDWDEPDDEYDTRYGIGIIDAHAATELVALDSGVEGTVTGAAGEPVEGATVSIEDGGDAETDENGEYTLLAAPGEYTVTATGFGYDEAEATVDIPDDETFVAQDFELGDALGVELVEGQPEGLEGGDAFDVVVNVANLETYMVESDGDYAGDLTFELDGDEIEEGEEIDVGDVTGEVTLSVTTEADTEGELFLDHTFSGYGDTVAVTTGPTTVFEEFVPTAVVDDGTYGDDVLDRLESELSDMYDLSLISGDEAVDAAADGDYDVYVVQNMDADVEAFLDDTDDAAVGVVWLDNWGSGSDGIAQKSDAVENPDSTSQGFSAPNPDFEITADHPVFDGLGDVGDTLPVHSAGFADATWFDGYDADVLGYIQSGSVDDGDGIAVDEEKNTMLLSSFGSSVFVDSEDFSAEADTLLGNSVEYVTSGEEPEPSADFEVTDVDPSGDLEVEPGEELEIDATVENLGDEGGTAITHFVFDGEELVTEEMELEPGESGTMTFDITAPDEEGEHDWHVATQHHMSDTWTLTVSEDDDEPSDATTVAIVDSDLDTETLEAELEARGFSDAEIEAALDEFDPDEMNEFSQTVRDGLDDDEYDVVDVSSEDLLNNTHYDVYVVSEFEEESDIIEFQDEIDDDAGVVYADSWAISGTNSLNALVDEIGDPAETDNGAFDDGDVTLELTADHPLFDGVGEAGDVITHMDGDIGSTDRRWFGGYEGGDSIADISVSGDDEVDGAGIGVSDDGSEVILASHARWSSSFTPDEAFTDESNQIVFNAIEYVAPEDEPEEPAENTVAFGDGEFVFAPGETDTVTMNTSADDVAGFEVFVDFDPEYVQVEDIEAADLDGTLVTDIDNENGTFAAALAQANGEDAPEMLDVELTFTGEFGDSADLMFDADSALFASDGEIDADFEDATLTAGQLGDVNNDGEITAFDAILIQQYIAGQEPTDDFYPALADVTQDGAVHTGDVIALLNTIVDGNPDGDSLDAQQDATSIDAGGAAVAL